tara:strand:+ start:162 stop:617 length:456 start_codon:yes stop_codon:yes gene_type:complete
MNKKMKIFISLSLLLNVLLVGIILGGVSGGFSKPHFDGGHKSAQMEQRLSHILAVLPAEKSELFKQRLAELRALKRTDKERMKLARRNILQVFQQEPFDKAAYQQAVQALNQLHQTQMDKRVSLMADVGEYLSPKERRQLSHLIMKRGGRK